jgi:hypothetical protein
MALTLNVKQFTIFGMKTDNWYTAIIARRKMGMTRQGFWGLVRRGRIELSWLDGAGVWGVEAGELRRYANERAEAARLEAERWERIAGEV